MRLDEYLFRSGITHADFAKKIGVSRPYLTLLSLGKKKPSPGIAKKIIAATEEKVSLNELMFPEDFPLENG